MYKYDEVKKILEENLGDFVGHPWEIFAVLKKALSLNQTNIDIVTKQSSDKSASLLIILNELYEVGLLDPDSINFNSLMSSSLSWSAITALDTLYKKKILTQESFDLVMKYADHPHCFNVPYVYEHLYQTPLSNPQNYDNFMNHADPNICDWALVFLKENNKLNQKNFNSIIRYPNPRQAAEILHQLDEIHYEQYFPELMRSPDPHKCMQVLHILEKAYVLEQGFNTIINCTDPNTCFDILKELNTAQMLKDSNLDFILKHMGSKEFLYALQECKKAKMLDLHFFNEILTHPHSNLIILLLKEANLNGSLDSERFRKIIQSNRFLSASELTSEFMSRLNQCFIENRIDEYFHHLVKIIQHLDPQDVKREIDNLLSSNQQPAQEEKAPHKIELLLIAQFEATDSASIGFNQELMDVIKMRQAVCKKKGHTLLVLPYETYQTIMQSTSEAVFPTVTKLSILHHYSENRFYKYQKGEEKHHPDVTDYLENIGHYAKRMPGLKEIILRGCGVVDSDSLKEHKEEPAVPSSIKILKKHQDIKSIQVKANVLLLLQKEEEGEISTYVKYMDPVKGLVLTCIPGIKQHDKLEEFSEPELQKISKNCGGLVLHTSHDNSKQDKQLLGKFFDEKRSMNFSEKQRVKKLHIRARTQILENFGESLAELVRKKLIEAKCFGISLKGSVSTYKAAPDRATPSISHAAEKLPKAGRVNIRGPGMSN